MTEITDDLHKGLILLKKILNNTSLGLINFKEINNTLSIIEKLLTRIENLGGEEDEEDYSLSVTLDDSPAFD